MATDGVEVIILRINSGAPPAGDSFRDATPCPAFQTKPLRLFPARNFRGPPPSLPTQAPRGFRALLRLCASPHALGGGGPLSLLREVPCDLDGHPLNKEGGVKALTLHERMGSGGTSDVYSLGDVDDPGGSVVVKVARYSSARVLDEFASERRALALLNSSHAVAQAGIVPRVIAVGERERPASFPHQSAGASAAAWPVLTLSPRGVPLEAWVTSRVDAAVLGAALGDAQTAAAAARVAAADCILPRILSALEAAHAAQLIHCDVRPSNMIVARGGAVLVDWGTVRATGEPLRWRGVAAFSDARVFSERGTTASPHIDALGALFSWLAIALGHNCVPPWLTRVRIDSEEYGFIVRADWLKEHLDVGVAGARVAAVARAVRELENVTCEHDASVTIARISLGL